mmetsp:Transcript_20434/g.57829  ORF Transcript_20434/g.57829 Transcript_20434/m.57829 type:complete len:221 (-) Transcript_20434:54-716(-)
MRRGQPELPQRRYPLGGGLRPLPRRRREFRGVTRHGLRRRVARDEEAASLGPGGPLEENGLKGEVTMRSRRLRAERGHHLRQLGAQPALRLLVQALALQLQLHVLARGAADAPQRDPFQARRGLDGHRVALGARRRGAALIAHRQCFGHSAERRLALCGRRRERLLPLAHRPLTRGRGVHVGGAAPSLLWRGSHRRGLLLLLVGAIVGHCLVPAPSPPEA